jgi:branched-chain amino acid aminotransferase
MLRRPSALLRAAGPSLRSGPRPRPFSSTVAPESDPEVAHPPAPPLDAASTTLERVARPKAVDESNPAFGTSFTGTNPPLSRLVSNRKPDHMLSVPWTADGGWATPSIHPLRPLSLHPATSSLQYAFQCFEGLKAYRATTDGSVRLFRPELNMARLNRAAARLCLPTFDPTSGVEVIKAFVRAEERFVPA